MDVQVQLLRQHAHPQLMASATNCLGSSYYHWNGEEENSCFPSQKKAVFFLSFFSLHFYFDQHFGMGFGGDASHTAARPSSLWRLLELQDAHCKHLRGGSERSAVVGSRKCTNIPRITSETLQFNYLFSFQLSFAQQRVANRSADTIQVNVDDVQEVGCIRLDHLKVHLRPPPPAPSHHRNLHRNVLFLTARVSFLPVFIDPRSLMTLCSRIKRMGKARWC